MDFPVEVVEGPCVRGPWPGIQRVSSPVADGNPTEVWPHVKWSDSRHLYPFGELDALLATEGEARPTDIARRLGVSHATVIKTVARLKKAGVATSRPYRGIFLT
jgi:hypothetical protein